MASGAGASEFIARDYLKVATNADLVKTLAAFRVDPRNAEALAGFPPTQEERVLFADNMIKVNRYGSRQQRTLVITSIAILNFKPKNFKEFQRRIPIAYIEELWTVTGTNELGEHPCWGSAVCPLRQHFSP